MLLALAENPAVGQSRLEDKHKVILTSVSIINKLMIGCMNHYREGERMNIFLIYIAVYIKDTHSVGND